MLATLTALAIGAAAAPAAAVLVYDTPVTTPGNQAYTSTVALNFTVTAPVTFNVLGVFDAGADGITGPVNVVVYDSNGTAVSPLVSFAGFANSAGTAYATQRVGDFTLAAGDYQIAAWGFSDSDNNYNSFGAPSLVGFNSFGGSLVATSVAYSTGAPGSFATIIEAPDTRYGAGTLGFVPEPATWAMLVIGFGMVGATMRRRTVVAA
ncbi:hypothetical protein IP88_04410 [alpha proteobacterium AAP81b]|nr:hypothetical protein IP88_04410 [alpha proteobacterium AAP81b]